MRFRSGSTLVAALLAAVVATVASAAEGEAVGVGFRRIATVDPVTRVAFDAGAFYPSGQPSRGQSFGPYDVEATLGADVADGRHPIVLISHGNGGGPFSHHDLATGLARRGAIVVVVSHPGDDHRDQSGTGGTGVIFGRPAQISAALDAVLADAAIGPRADAARVGFVGFSAGGTTGLLLAGAKPELSRLEAYCAERPREPGVCEAGGRIRRDRAEPATSVDRRIGALALIAPLSVVFPAEEIGRIELPVGVWVGGADRVLAPEPNALALAQALPGRPAVRVEPEAGHFTYLAPCSARLAASVPALCRDGAGIDRAALHRRLIAEIGDFFARSLVRRTPPG